MGSIAVPMGTSKPVARADDEEATQKQPISGIVLIPLSAEAP